MFLDDAVDMLRHLFFARDGGGAAVRHFEEPDNQKRRLKAYGAFVNNNSCGSVRTERRASANGEYR